MKDITIHDFRCFSEKHLEFRPGINLIIGDNSSGKTSLIRACNYVTNAFFSGYSDENTVWKSIDDNDFKLNVGEDNVIQQEKPIIIDFHLSESDLLPVNMPDGSTFRFDYKQQLSLEKRSKKNSRKLTSGLSVLKEYCSKIQDASHIFR